MQETPTTDLRELAVSQPVTGEDGADDRGQSTSAAPRLVERKTLSVRRVIKVGEGGTTTTRPLSRAGGATGAGDTSARAKPAASAGSSSAAVPLKRLTAGRKEISILHDGSTYLLRITKSNKLILTKA